MGLPVGLAYDGAGHVVLDPDAGVQQALRHLFALERQSQRWSVGRFHVQVVARLSGVGHADNHDWCAIDGVSTHEPGSTIGVEGGRYLTVDRLKAGAA